MSTGGVDVSVIVVADRRRHQELRFFRQAALIVGSFVAYMAVRAVANDAPSIAISNAHDLLEVERAIGLAIERSVQEFALDRPLLVDFFNVVYAWTYWPLLIGTFVYTWIRRRDLFVVCRNAIFVSGALGLVIFLFFPVAPPRFLDGFVDTVAAADRSHGLTQPRRSSSTSSLRCPVSTSVGSHLPVS